VTIQNETRALQCDKCMKDKWKCIDCLGIPAEVYDGLIDCKDIFWFCEDCSGDKQKDSVSGDDRVISLLEKMMDRLGAIEDRLKEKVDEKKVEELDQRVKSLESFVKEQLEEREQNTGGRKSRGSMNDAGSSAVESVDSIEDRETEKRRNNIVIYRAPEVDSEQAEDRKCGDAAFVHELCCYNVLEVDIDGCIEQMYRLGKREHGKVRPLLVKFAPEEKKSEILRKVNYLKDAPAMFKSLSIARDLTVRQRERVKECRKKALEESQGEVQAADSDGEQVNFRIIVVGQTTTKPRAMKIPIDRN